MEKGDVLVRDGERRMIESVGPMVVSYRVSSDRAKNGWSRKVLFDLKINFLGWASKARKEESPDG